MMPRKLVVILLFLSGLFAAQVNGQEICYDDHTGEMYFTSLVGVSSIQFESKDPNTLQNVPFSGQFFHCVLRRWKFGGNQHNRLLARSRTIWNDVANSSSSVSWVAAIQVALHSVDQQIIEGLHSSGWGLFSV
jgi:hypothetical protein